MISIFPIGSMVVRDIECHALLTVQLIQILLCNTTECCSCFEDMKDETSR